MPKIDIIEKDEYYDIDETEVLIPENIFIFDAVKKVIKDNPYLFWITVIGGVKLLPEPSFTKTFSFYIKSTLQEDKNSNENYDPTFEKLRKFGLEFSSIFENYKPLENFLLNLSNFENDYVIGLISKIKDIDEYEIRDFVEKYTNNFMSLLESLVVYSFCKNDIKKSAFVISDGSLVKFKRFRKLDNVKMFGLIKEVERNYLYQFGNSYLYNLPFLKRSAAFYLVYDDIKFLSFYMNIGKIIRLEVLDGKIEELLLIAKILKSISHVPHLYYRMPQNNLILTKLERNLKNYIMNDVLFDRFI